MSSSSPPFERRKHEDSTEEKAEKDSGEVRGVAETEEHLDDDEEKFQERLGENEDNEPEESERLDAHGNDDSVCR